MRIDKLLSHLKYCTRSEAKQYLNMHTVLVNGKRVLSPGEEVFPERYDITIDGEIMFYKPEIHLMMYKPIGYISANHDRMFPCATDFIKEPYHRFDFSIAGRLDVDAEGLLILTTSGTLVHEITSPRKHLEKIYEVILDKPFRHEKKLMSGVEIQDGKSELYTAKALHIETKGNVCYLTIDEGKFHQVKRMFKAVGYEVLNLKRIQIGALKLGKLAPGEYIEFNKENLYD